MIVKDETKNERKITATFSENDIRAILTKKLAEEQDFKIDPHNTLIKVRFDKKDEDTRGFVNCVEITMRNKLGV